MTNRNFFTTVANQIRPILGMTVIPTPKAQTAKKSLRTYYVQAGRVYGKKPEGNIFTTIRASSLAEALAYAAL